MKIIKIITIYILFLPTLILAYDLSQQIQVNQIIKFGKEGGVYHPELKIKTAWLTVEFLEFVTLHLGCQ